MRALFFKSLIRPYVRGRTSIAAHFRSDPKEKKGTEFSGWALSNKDRSTLLAAIPPAYSRVVADHITEHFGAGAADRKPASAEASIVGYIDDGRGLQALVVQINGRPLRHDGAPYHITWSIAPGRKTQEAGDVILRNGYKPFPAPIPISTTPTALS